MNIAVLSCAVLSHGCAPAITHSLARSFPPSLCVPFFLPPSLSLSLSLSFHSQWIPRYGVPYETVHASFGVGAFGLQIIGCVADAGVGVAGVTVAAVNQHGTWSAELCTLVHVGDELVTVGEGAAALHVTQQTRYHDVANAMSTASRPIRLTFRRELVDEAGAAAMSPSAPPAPQHHTSRVDTTGLLTTEARLTALYRMNDPTKDATVIAEKFRRGGFGDESQLFSLLIQKYGQEAIDASDAAALDELMDEV